MSWVSALALSRIRGELVGQQKAPGAAQTAPVHGHHEGTVMTMLDASPREPLCEVRGWW